MESSVDNLTSNSNNNKIFKYCKNILKHVKLINEEQIYGEFDDKDNCVIFFEKIKIIHKNSAKVYNLLKNKKFEWDDEELIAKKDISQSIQIIEKYILINYHKLSILIECSRSLLESNNNSNDKRHSPFICLYIVLSKLAICFSEYKSRYFTGKNNKNNITQRDLKTSDFMIITGVYKLPQINNPILKMNLEELVKSITSLRDKWPYIKYIPKLSIYLGILEYRLFHFMNELFTNKILNYEPYTTILMEKDFREKINICTINDKCIWELSSIIQNMKIKLSHTFIGIHKKIPDIYNFSSEYIDSIKNWLIERAKSPFSDQIANNYRDLYINRIILPGELEIYLLKYIRRPRNTQEIYKFTRGNSALRNIQEFATEREDWDPLLDDEKYNSVSLSSMSYVLLSNFFSSKFKNIPFSTFCIFQDEIQSRYQELLHEDYPFIVESFNFFNVYYKGDLFILNGFYESLACFLKIIDIDYQGCPGNDTSIVSLYHTIFGPNESSRIKKNWTEKNLHNYSHINTLETKNLTIGSKNLQLNETNNNNNNNLCFQSQTTTGKIKKTLCI